MSAATQQTVSRPKRAALLASLLLALMLLVSLFALPVTSAYADEPQEAPIEEQQESSGADSSSVTPEYEVFTFDSEDIIDAQTNQSGNVIPDTEVPLANSISSEKSQTGTGSIFNTVLIVLCVVSMLSMLIALSVRKTKDYRVIAARTVAVAVGLVTIATWSLMDKLQAPTVVFNDFTLLISALFAIYVVLAVYSYIYETRLNKAEKAQSKD